MKYLLVILAIFLSGCSSTDIKEAVVSNVFEHVAGVDVHYNGAGCFEMKNRCHEDKYEEWKQDNGKIACACNK